jgi:hypothetical protein
VYFNLSQAHGQAFQVDELNHALETAQRIDGEVVAELTELQGSETAGFTVDLPLPRRAVWKRILTSTSGAAIAAELQALIAPGKLGANWWVAAGAFGLSVILAATGSLRLRRSHRCARCGRRLCPRCDPEFDGGEICEGCTRLYHHPETTDRALRTARIGALQLREERLDRAARIVSILLPGSAGILAQRHWSSLIACLAAGLALAAIFWRNGLAPDPLVAGAAAPLVFGALAISASLVYAIAVGVSLASLKRS